MGIPKLIHITWVQGIPPKKYHANINSWIRHNPDYVVRIWDEQQFLEELRDDTQMHIERLPSELLETYDNTTRMAGKMDIMRIYVMKKYGGVFVDMDMMCVNSIANTLGEIEDPIMCRTVYNSVIMKTVVPIVPDVYFIASSKNHPLWDKAIENAVDFIRNKDLFDLPAARGLIDVYFDTDFIKKYNITVCSDELIVRSEKDVTKNTLAIHECHATWKDNFLSNATLVFRDSAYMDLYIVLFILIIVISVSVCAVIIVKQRRKRLMSMY